jgi:uncharacterized protein (TIGR03437 family)
MDSPSKQAMTYHRIFQLVLFIAAAIAAWGQPRITNDGVRNSASYSPAGFVNTGIAQGSIFTIFGDGLGPDTLQQASIPLPKILAGTSVQVSASGQNLNAPLFYVSAHQVAALLPSSTPTGEGAVTVTYQGQTSKPLPITVAKRKIGLFTLNQAGTGPAVIQNFNSQNDQPVNTVVSPARPGQTVTLWADGLGPVSGDEASTPQPGDLGPISIYVGGVPANVRYAGRSGCCLGADQIIFDVPQGIEGCYVPVIAVSGSFAIPALVGHVPLDGPSSNFATMSISSSGTCTDPTGLTGDDIQRLQSRGSLALAGLEFTQMEDGLTSDTASARFGRVDAARFLRSKGIFGLPAFGSCLGYESMADPVQFDPLDAGPGLNISGPRGSRTLARQAPGGYSATFQDRFFSPGGYTIDNGSGGADVGPFRATFNIPQPVNWLNPNISGNNISPELDWTGGDPNGYVVISDVGANDLSNAITICTAATSAGSFRIPPYAYVLTGVDGPFGASPNTVAIGSASLPVRFSAPGIDLGLITSTVFVKGTNIE